MDSCGYYVDEKFGDVIACLKRDGWSACPHWTFPQCTFRFVNYAKINWSCVKPNVIINHLENAVLLSQKHELLQHLLRHSPTVHHRFLPRSCTCRETWRNMFLYAQILLVLKNPTRYRAYVTLALSLAEEVLRLNPNSKKPLVLVTPRIDCSSLSVIYICIIISSRLKDSCFYLAYRIDRRKHRHYVVSSL